MIDRRSVCLGTAAAMAAGTVVYAEPDKPLFASGPLAGNFLAASFKTPPASVVLPDTPLLSAHGPQRLSQLRGRNYIVSLWAEWCAPCLEEATDLAMISRTRSGPSLGVIFVLTSSDKKLDVAGAQAVLAKRDAGDVTLFVEANGGKAVMNALATQDYDAQWRAIYKKARGSSLPCNLLVDRHGRVRGRSFGAPGMTQTLAPAGTKPGETIITATPMTEADKERALKEHTMWATSIGSQFITALAAGILEKA